MHELSVAVCGREFWVRRELALLRRLEQEVGAMGAFCRRLEAEAVPIDDIVRVVLVLLKGQTGAPLRSELDLWLFGGGGVRQVARHLAMSLYTLVLSDDEVRELERRQAGIEQGAQAGGDARGPFKTTG